MHVPPGGGPPPHRHDFEETFTELARQLELTFRGERLVAVAGETVNVPANAPHSFTNAPVATRTEQPPELHEAAAATFIAKPQALAPQYRTELLRP